MPGKSSRRSAAGRDLAAISLVATIACAGASGALAGPSPPDANAALAARVAALVERISLHEPALMRDLPPERNIAQWRN